MQQNNVNVLDFPPEIINMFLCNLDGTSMVNLSLTCRSFNNYCKYPPLWKTICAKECPNMPTERFNDYFFMCWLYNSFIQTKTDMVPQLLENIVRNKARHQSLQEFRKILSWRKSQLFDTCSNVAFDQPEVPNCITTVLLPIIKEGTIVEKIETVRCIANMAADAPPKSNKYAEFSEPLSKIIVAETNHVLILETLNAIRNIAGDGTSNRNLLLNATLVPIVSLMKREMIQKNMHSNQILNAAAMALTGLCRGKPAPTMAQVSVILPVLIELIYYEEKTLIGNVLWAYSGVTEQSSKPLVNAVAKQKITTRLLELVQSPFENVFYPAMRVIGNILVSDEEEHTKMFLHEGFLPLLERFLHHDRLAMRKEAAWALSNIAATSPYCIHAIIKFGLVPTIIKKMAEDDLFVRKEAAFAIANIIWKGNSIQAREVVQEGCLPLMVALAQTQGVPEQVVQLVVETFENLLRPSIPTVERAEYAAIISGFRSFLQQVANSQTTMSLVNMSTSILQKIPSTK